MAWQQFLDDAFTRANGGTVGNNWTDVTTGIWSINSNALRATVGAAVFGYPLTRLSSERRIAQRAVIRTLNAGNDRYWIFEARRQSGGNRYILVGSIDASGVGQIYAFKSVSGTLTQIVSSAIFTYVAGHELEFDLSVTGSGTTSLSISIKDINTSTTLQTATGTDTEATLQGTGLFSLDAYSATPGQTVDFNEVILYNDDGESPPSIVNTVADTGLYWSKNWLVSSSDFAMSNSPGAYMRTKFTGSSLSIIFNCAGYAGIANGSRPIIRASAGNGVWVDTELSAGGTTTIALITGAVTNLLVEVYYRANLYTLDNWNTPTNAVIATGFTSDGTFSLPDLRTNGTAVIYGDSLTAGINSIGSGYNPVSQDATMTFPYYLARGMGWEYAVRGFGSNNYDNAGDGNVPLFYSGGTWNHLWSGQLMDLSPFTDCVLFVGTGTNGTISSSDVQGLLTDFHAANGTCRLWQVLPTTTGNHSALIAGFNAFIAAHPTALAYLITLPYTEGMDAVSVASRYYSDALVHYNQQGHAIVGTMMAAQIKAVAGAGGVVTATVSGGNNIVSWLPIAGATTYDVLRASAQIGPFTVIASAVAGLSYTDTSPPGGNVYYSIVGVP